MFNNVKVFRMKYRFQVGWYGILIAVPAVLLVCIAFGNTLYDKYGFDIIPSGIYNEQLFLFSASYIAGVCTLIAFLHTAEANRKALKYQSDIQSIFNEQKRITNLLTSFKILDFHRIYKDFFNSLGKDATFEVSKVREILSYILASQQKLITEQLSLVSETNIYTMGCPDCMHFEKCTQGKIKYEFTEIYLNLYNDMYDKYSKLYDYLSIIDKNVSLKVEISDDRRELERKLYKRNEIKELWSDDKQKNEALFLINSIIAKIEQNIERNENALDQERENTLHEDIMNIFKSLNSSTSDEIHKLLELSKQYITEKKRLALDELHGKKSLCFQAKQEDKKG